VWFGVLGPFEAQVGGRAVPLGAARQRVLLAALLAQANAVVSTDRLIDIVWGDEPPNTALSTLQKYVYRLRGSLGDLILTRPPGYLLRLGDGESDASRFESLLGDAGRMATAGEVDEAIAAFDAALAMWRGPAWAEFADFDFTRVNVARLEGLRATAIDDRAEVALAAGRHAEVIGELEGTVAAYPLRERPHAQLMLALYRTGRHADALRAYDAYRRYLGEEVGLEPSTDLAQLADAILVQKPDLAWVPPPGARGRTALPSGIVTFLFSDIEGSTRLFRRLGRTYVDVLERHRQLVRGAVASGGGVEVNSEGDGLFFAFSNAGAAVGASVAAQRALSHEPWTGGAEVRVRMGLHTGEATPHNGDYVALPAHQAARVKDAAHGGQVLLSGATLAAVVTMPDDCSVLRLGTFPLNDFEDGVELLEVHHPSLPATFPPPRVGVPMRPAAPLPAVLAADTEPLVGRATELEWLDVLWQRAVAGASVTAVVHGPPGIGKSRLVAEFARRASARGATVTVGLPDVARGGEPVVAVLDDFDGAALDPAARGAFVLAASRAAVAGTPNVRELRGLGLDEVSSLLATKVEMSTRDLCGAVLTETGGNPGKIHDVARRLRDREAEERVQRALDRVGAATHEARTLRDQIADGVLERDRLSAQTAEPPLLGVCPYKGLARYEATDAPFFYGRERLVATLVARIGVDRFVGIIGASGSGKSSLVRAGLLPALSAGSLPGSGAWPTCTCTPGEHPLRRLAEALAPLVGLPAAELARRLDSQPDELGSILQSALRGRERARVVVVIDQFEELATLCRDQQERERFAGALVDAVTDPDIPAVVVPVVRADYYGTLAVHPDLPRLFEQSQLLVGAMSDAELRRAITEPARRAGLVLEDGLADAVCADAGSEPGSLPLVSTAMAETWVHRDGAILTLTGYRQAGGVHGALARLADDVYGGLDDEEQAQARRLFLRLAEPGEGTDDLRRRMPRAELSSGGQSAVLDAFVDRRLVIADAESVEVAHEALLREWPRLRTWLEEDRAGRRLHRRLTVSAAGWDSEGRDPGALYRGTRLDAALEWAGAHGNDVNAVEREFLDTSAEAQQSELRRARRTARRFRSLASALAVVLVVALLAGGLALVQRSRANHQAKAARQEAGAAEQAKTVSDATALASQARVLPATQLDVALLLAVQGRRLHDSSTTDGALEAVLSKVPPGLEQRVPLRDVNVLTTQCTDPSPDGRLLAACSTDGTARVIDLTSGRVTESLLGNRGTILQCLQFSPDGTRLVGSDINGDVFVWDVASGRRLGPTINTNLNTAARFTRTVFGSDSQIVTATGSGVVRVWDISDPLHPAAIGGPYTGLFAPPGFVDGFAPRTFLAPGGDLLAFDNAGHTEVWDITTHKLAYAPLPGGTIGESPDGSILATAFGHQIDLWDLASGQPRGQPLDGFVPQGFGQVLFSRDGRRAAVPSNNTVTVVDLSTHKSVGEPIAGQTIRYLDDGLVVVGVGQTIELWRPDVTTPAPFATELAGATIPGLAHWLSPSTVYGLPGTVTNPLAQVGALDISGPASEWDAATGTLGGALLGGQQPAVAHAGPAGIVNPGGTLAALGEGGQIELWDIDHHRQVAVIDPGQRQPIATWDPTSAILATTGLGGSLALWDVSDLAHIALLARTTVPGYAVGAEPSVRFSPDGGTIAMWGPLLPESGTTSLVSVPSGRVRQVVRSDGFTLGSVFTSDSKRVATIQDSFSTNAHVTVWDVATGHLQATFSLPYPELESIAFVNGDQWLITVQSAQLRFQNLATITSEVDIWDATTRQPVGVPVLVHGDAGAVEVDRPGGSRLVSSTSVPGGTYAVWDLTPADWASMACKIAGRNLTQSEWKQYLPGRPYELTCPQWQAGT
jgi:class 3 adenylate cyclase/WD40 repeat protein